ncbi:Periplasmic beta-glucosidase [Hypsibius exemplaris]|uniref:beta-glucosidase n=1 Tax=Hypsibius exemplaris TaxID=2072580 RepID=A0A1W0WCC6_HYPEX|nr:Periplasmic beta-glucosidase [Hypsibius exemplaris]
MLDARELQKDAAEREPKSPGEGFMTPADSSGAKDADLEDRIRNLLDRMSLQEKLGQLQMAPGSFTSGDHNPAMLDLARRGLIGSVLNVRGARNTNELISASLESRLKIPILLGFDVIHGYRTLFPIPLACAATWDLTAVERSTAIAAAEARSAGVQWTFAPMVDLARDPRWGRVQEGAGEDTFLGGEMAKAQVRGFQGTDYSRNDKIMACAKHFAAYGAAEAGLDYNAVDMSERRLREIYLPPFKAAADAGAGSFMTAYMDLNGVPATANSWLLQTVLREEWQFDGMVVSDFLSVSDLITHGLAANLSEAGRYALNAGVDVEMASTSYGQFGAALLAAGQVSIETINERVSNVLRAKFRLGLFNRPFPFADEQWENQTLLKAEFRQAAREMAAQSFVLLKNDRRTLPINLAKIRALTLIGSLADDTMPDLWKGDSKAEDTVTILQGIRDKLSAVRSPSAPLVFRYEKGCEPGCPSDRDFPAALDAARTADFVILVVGELANASGEAASLTDLNLSGRQLDLVKAVADLGVPYAVVLRNGRPLTIEWLAENASAILVTWHPGTMGGAAVADVLFGDVNPSGKLPITFPRNVGQIPLYYAHKNPPKPAPPFTSHYLDSVKTPLYPFGFGLSYTTFSIEELRLSASRIRVGESVTVSVEVRNIGQREGQEVVQLYIHDLVARITQPIRQLKAFQKISLTAGEVRRIEFVLGSEELAYLDPEFRMTVEPGAFDVYVGNSSDATLTVRLFVHPPASSHSHG